MVSKFVGVYPLTRLFKSRSKEAMYTTLLMSTGLTFGSISALFGLTHEIITQQQYSLPGRRRDRQRHRADAHSERILSAPQFGARRGSGPGGRDHGDRFPGAGQHARRRMSVPMNALQ